MPITKSAKKAMRQSKSREARNNLVRSDLKRLSKQFSKALTQKKQEEAAELLGKLFSKVDKAAKTGVVHKNRAARVKSLFYKRAKKEFGENFVLPKKSATKKSASTAKPAPE